MSGHYLTDFLIAFGVLIAAALGLIGLYALWRRK
jgi:hypothetical protein